MSSSHLLSIQPQDALKSVTPLNEANYGDWIFQMQARLMQSTISWLVVKGDMARPVGPNADDSAVRSGDLVGELASQLSTANTAGTAK